MNPNHQGPTKFLLNTSNIEVKLLSKTNKHWFCGGPRSMAAAVNLLLNGEVIALPTDTIYGFAALAQNQDAIEKLYKIKKRDESKPLAICVYSIKDVHNWGVVDTLPTRFLEDLLPGPVTVVLKRTANLNPGLNPGIDNVGIRVPNSKFIRNVVKMINQPLALTSANESNKPSSLHPKEFEELWPQLGGIFYPIQDEHVKRDSKRVGSTVVDLSIYGKFKILRPGVAHKSVVGALKNRQWVQEEDSQ
ncbi:yrdC domain-containing protein, mitochondrial [Cephus cinctus]|uniref:Threonylcarbamoyl-AMP synthase n=1 Tax=Cephus cinctus TaxID=211228 RepID=A0AAJ7BPU5_CEPCN|nr:yrdC domain-containing protein, mitochondrial [Cephus cinctus]